jgi:hypothetical protein
MASLRRVRLPSPALAVAVAALAVALGGTAVAAGVVPLAKRAYVADNAKKLGGKDCGAGGLAVCGQGGVACVGPDRRASRRLVVGCEWQW